ncbi:MAG: hypothetical protein ACKV2Q_34580 [Planctomycetaceae bacterium]
MIVSKLDELRAKRQLDLEERERSRQQAAKAEKIEDDNQQIRRDWAKHWVRAAASWTDLEHECSLEAIDDGQELLKGLGLPNVGDDLFGTCKRVIGCQKPYFDLTNLYTRKKMLEMGVPKKALGKVEAAMKKVNAASSMKEARVRDESIRRMRELVEYLRHNDWLGHLYELNERQTTDDRTLLLMIGAGATDDDLREFDVIKLIGLDQLFRTKCAMEKQIWPELDSEASSGTDSETSNAAQSQLLDAKSTPQPRPSVPNGTRQRPFYPPDQEILVAMSVWSANDQDTLKSSSKIAAKMKQPKEAVEIKDGLKRLLEGGYVKSLSHGKRGGYWMTAKGRKKLPGTKAKRKGG